MECSAFYGLPLGARIGIFAAAVGEMAFSMLAPFFPGAAADRGVSPQAVGFVFGCMPLGQLVTAPLVQAIRTGTGSNPKSLLVFATMAHACLAISLGLAGALRSAASFVACASVLRFCQGAMTSLMEVTLTALIFRSLSSTAAATAYSLLMGCRGIAMLTGPAIGGELFEMGGYMLPFLASGMLFAASMVALTAAPPMLAPLPAQPNEPAPWCWRRCSSHGCGSHMAALVGVGSFWVVMGFQFCVVFSIGEEQVARRCDCALTMHALYMAWPWSRAGEATLLHGSLLPL